MGRGNGQVGRRPQLAHMIGIVFPVSEAPVQNHAVLGWPAPIPWRRRLQQRQQQPPLTSRVEAAAPLFRGPNNDNNPAGRPAERPR